MLGTVTEEMSLLLFLETHSSGPLTALGQLHGGAVIWKESSLTAVSMNPARRERVALESANPRCISVHLSAATEAHCGGMSPQPSAPRAGVSE